ncbi:YheC/YheD family protein [Desulfovibrio inopinatus]|uniref:YheC/YheD family protein n=1 Tax=Desulfovibrio inopinatus TaxID=102109 RepID=UPI0004187647|nr:YheC/YheD family protein [Desulfovibrio inopinatus]
MPTPRIGYVSFRTDIQKAMPPMRLRALHAEAILHGARIELLDWSDFREDSDKILVWTWSPSGWQSERKYLSDITVIVGSPVNEQQRRLIEWIKATRPYIYDIGINKLKLAALLHSTQYERYLIPDAQIPKEESGEFIANFLTKYGSSVIKRSNANKGVGLLFVLKEQSGWRISDKKNIIFTLTEIVNEIMSRIKGRLAYRDFVIQKYIKSTATDGRAADIRAHVQRGYDQTWGITRVYVRLAEVGSLATNISLGGYQGPLMKYLELRKNRSASEIEAEIQQAALEIAEIQSATSPHPLSELGLDFLLDDEDKIWLVETNTHPQSSLHEHERAIDTVNYALALAGLKSNISVEK